MTEVKEFRTYKWQVTNYFFDLDITDTYLQGIDMSNLLDNLLRSFEKRLASNPGPLVKLELVRAIFILSDLFSQEEFAWMAQLFTQFMNEDEIEDFLLRHYLILGICKVSIDFIQICVVEELTGELGCSG
jgi:hypothetical protein